MTPVSCALSASGAKLWDLPGKAAAAAAAILAPAADARKRLTLSARGLPAMMSQAHQGRASYRGKRRVARWLTPYAGSNGRARPLWIKADKMSRRSMLADNDVMKGARRWR